MAIPPLPTLSLPPSPSPLSPPPFRLVGFAENDEGGEGEGVVKGKGVGGGFVEGQVRVGGREGEGERGWGR